MKKVFVKTNNVKRFISMYNNLLNRAEGVPGLGLVYGEPGLGKTQTINWWAFKNDIYLVRCNNLMSTKWLLVEILDAMGEYAPRRIFDCFNIIIKNLMMDPKPIIVDEIDYLMMDAKAVETIRDIHDRTGVPIILVGMDSANSKLKKYKHLYDRISEIVRFEPFSRNDIKTIVGELAEIEFTDCAMQYLYKSVNRFRQLVKIINKAENFAKANGLNSVDETTLKEVMTVEKEAIEPNPTNERKG